MTSRELWQRYCNYLCAVPELDLTLDVSRMTFDDAFLGRMEPAMQDAFAAMDALESGAIANPDEKRMVGHYWLRAPELAPTAEITTRSATPSPGSRRSPRGPPGRDQAAEGRQFTQVLSIGIGGSALGPEFVPTPSATPADKMAVHFIDNTDPDGIARVLASLVRQAGETLVLVISKSGGTPEPRNGMLVVADAYKKAGLDFAQHAVAITGPGSHLDKQAEKEGWLTRFPMWDWVGGRTSELGPSASCRRRCRASTSTRMLAGAADGRVTRKHDTRKNPAALLALMWYHATDGKGAEGHGRPAVQGSPAALQPLSAAAGHGVARQAARIWTASASTRGSRLRQQGFDRSACLRAAAARRREQLLRHLRPRAGRRRRTRSKSRPGVTPGDYLHGFLLGTRRALFDNDRQSMTITVQRVDARTIGALIALFERAVGFYASLVNINAYHQPGVEAGKKAAAAVLALQAKVVAALSVEPRTAEQIAGSAEDTEAVYAILTHLAANGRAKAGDEADPAKQLFRRT